MTPNLELNRDPSPAARRRRSQGWPLALAVPAAFLLGGLVLPHVKVEWVTGPAARDAAVAAPVVSGLPGAEEPIARAAAAVSPAVVNIDTVSKVTVGTGDPFFDQFFGRRTVQKTGEGSGFVIDDKGHILTNEHVVSGATEITVTMSTGKRLRGRVVGSDRFSDVALVQVEGKGLPVAPLGKAQGLRPGQWAIAIGNPYGFQQTVTAGVVSNVARPVNTGDRSYERLIQTDAAINPGNSGGPLVDGHGRVVGVNTVVLAEAQGIGFAIPIEVALRVTDELIRHGRVNRPWTGFSAQNITPEIANYLGMAQASGAIVDQVVRDSPADRAGLRPGDILLQLDGKKISSADEVRARLKTMKIGDKLTVTVVRGDRVLKGEIIVENAP
jgi:S1-C subfamily serine protease